MDKTPQESDIAFIRALAELLRETDLTEIEVNREYGDDDVLTVRVARQITVTAPRLSTAGKRRMIARRRAMRCTPKARMMVSTAGKPSGIAATARPTEAINMSLAL